MLSLSKGGSAVNWTLRQEVEDSARRKMAVRQSDADAAGWGAVRLASKDDAAALLRSLAAASSSSSQQHQGVLLEVFAPWCSTCSKIKPLLSAAAKELQQVDGLFSCRLRDSHDWCRWISISGGRVCRGGGRISDCRCSGAGAGRAGRRRLFRGAAGGAALHEDDGLSRPVLV